MSRSYCSKLFKLRLSKTPKSLSIPLGAGLHGNGTIAVSSISQWQITRDNAARCCALLYLAVSRQAYKLS